MGASSKRVVGLRLALTAGTAVAASMGTAQAAMPGLYFSGFYMDSTLAYASTDASIENFDGSTEELWVGDGGDPVRAESVIRDKTDLGFSLAFGYRLNDYLATEISYVDMGTVKYRWSGTVTYEGEGTFQGDTFVSAKNKGLMLAGIVSWPLGDHFAIDARSGLLLGKSKVNADAYLEQQYYGSAGGSDKRNSLLLGAGINWSMAPGTAIRIGYVQLNKAMLSEYDVTAWTLSLKYAW